MMKRLLPLFMVFSLLLLAACNNSPSSSVSTEASSVPASVSSEASSASVQATKSEESTPSGSISAEAPVEMNISSSAIVNGVIDNEYGMHGAQIVSSIPTLSLPIEISDAPEETICYALTMFDPDSVPLAGYEWAHWLVANIKTTELPANASREMAETLLQGMNDFGTIGYGGPTPPDKDHHYVITVYALDAELDLDEGFSGDELIDAMEGHILAEATLEGIYRK